MPDKSRKPAYIVKPPSLQVVYYLVNLESSSSTCPGGGGAKRAAETASKTRQRAPRFIRRRRGQAAGVPRACEIDISIPADYLFVCLLGREGARQGALRRL